MFKRATVLAALALFALATRPALAQQVMVDINPFGGIYFPISDLIDQDIEGVAVKGSQKLGPLFGARVTVWLNESFGVEGGFAYAISDAEQELPVASDTSANVMLATVKGLYQFAPSPGTPFMLHFGAGGALIMHGGDAYEDLEGTMDIGATIIFGGTYDVSDMVAIRFDAQDFMYQAKFEEEDGFETDGKFQNDLVFTGGVVIKLGR
jgi:hypothetical protein